MTDAQFPIAAVIIAMRLIAVTVAQDPYEQARLRLVNEDIIGAGVTHQGVIDVMRRTPRHRFVPAAQQQLAYFDISLPIGDQQTISSPFIVAFMTQALDPLPTDKVLEIGTGSGYQAAVLSPLVKEVYTIEIVASLGHRAERILRRLNYRNVKVKVGDGFLGWPEHAPFDKIIVTCSPEKVPQPLIDQLREGGRLVIPVGQRYQQTLYLFVKRAGELRPEALRPTLFVPMTGQAEAGREVQPDSESVNVRNGSFEEPPDESGHVPGWYYQRQIELVSDQAAPDGQNLLRLRNLIPGRASRALQGLAVDGRKIKRLKLSAWVEARNVTPGPRSEQQPRVMISFYDSQRSVSNEQWLGPWLGHLEGKRYSRVIRVPISAREAIIRVDMLGATGELDVDDISLQIQTK